VAAARPRDGTMTDPAELWSGSRRSRLLAWALAGTGLLVFALVSVEQSLTRGWPGLWDALLGGAPLVVFFVLLGTLLALRQPGNAIGWLLLAGGLTWLLTGAGEYYVAYAVAHNHVTETARLAAGFNYSGWPVGVLCSVGLPLLLFPAGRTRSPRWRWVLVAMVTGCALVLVSSIVSTEPVVGPGSPPATLVNPWGVERLAAVSGFGRFLGVVLVMTTSLVAVVGIAVRFRSAAGTERQQLRWVRAGGVLAVAGMLSHPIGTQVLGLNPTLTDILVTTGIGSLPVCFTIAILRYRLYDLDRVVSRTVTYAAVTGLLVATYVGLVTAVSRLTPSSSSLSVAASTLAVAALFQPLRRRVQAVVDQRFNRARYDAECIVEAFSRRLREQVDLDLVRAELLTVARQSMQPVSATLWLRGADVAPS